MFAPPLLAQCGDALPIEALSDAERAERKAVLAFGHWLGGTRTELLSRFGQPVGIRGDSTSFFNATPVDSSFEWRYSAFSVSLIKNGESAGELASHVALTGRMANAPASLQLEHVDTALVRRLLGPTATPSIHGDTLRLCVTLTGAEDAEEEVRLVFIAGRLVRALWAFYMG